jgi:hypothetical protein
MAAAGGHERDGQALDGDLPLAATARAVVIEGDGVLPRARPLRGVHGDVVDEVAVGGLESRLCGPRGYSSSTQPKLSSYPGEPTAPVDNLFRFARSFREEIALAEA